MIRQVNSPSNLLISTPETSSSGRSNEAGYLENTAGIGVTKKLD
jgi:hypothetical protein